MIETARPMVEVLADREIDVVPDPAGTGRGWTAVRAGNDEKGAFESWIGDFWPDYDGAAMAALEWTVSPGGDSSREGSTDAQGR